MTPVPVIGRFAPSPGGDLHFGSLVSAVGSFLEARETGGKWLIRIENIDPPRELPGSAQRIIGDLKTFGMESDAPVLYQSERFTAYQDAVNKLVREGQAYPCACSRKDLPASGIYPGTCRTGIAKGKEARSIRFFAHNTGTSFVDKLQGLVQDPIDDFIIRRADGYFAYQLAVVVDDDFQEISQVVRGADLLDSTVRQIALQNALGYITPEYMHLPLVVSTDGKKLSKRVFSDPIQHHNPIDAVTMALKFLGQNPPTGVSLKHLWAWAFEHWNRNLIPRKKAILPVPLSPIE
jgi:glutamyl-Q tRNA(Asp) synthetase